MTQAEMDKAMYELGGGTVNMKAEYDEALDKYDDFDEPLEMPLPVKRDEHGPVSDKTVKELLAKINEELDELKEIVLFCKPLDFRCNYQKTHRDKIADEAADTITAITTLLDALGIYSDERAAAITRCNKRNRERGRL